MFLEQCLCEVVIIWCVYRLFDDTGPIQSSALGGAPGDALLPALPQGIMSNPPGHHQGHLRILISPRPGGGMEGMQGSVVVAEHPRDNSARLVSSGWDRGRCLPHDFAPEELYLKTVSTGTIVGSNTIVYVPALTYIDTYIWAIC